MHGDLNPELTNSITKIIKSYHRDLDIRPTGMTPRVSGPGGIRAVLFDVYGTLMISGSGEVGSVIESSRAQPFTRAFSDAGFEECEEWGERAAGLFRAEIAHSHAISKSVGIAYPEVDIQKVWQSVISKLDVNRATERRLLRKVAEIAVRHECISNPTTPMPAAKKIIRMLKESKIVLGIVSNAQFYTPFLFDAYLGESIRSLGFSEDACAWSFEDGIAKPSTELFNRPLKYLMNEYGIEPSETLYVGNDMLNDIWASRENGCMTALFAGDERSLRLRQGHPEASLARPDFVITELSQLGSIVI